MNRYVIQDLAEGLKRLGLIKGDIVLVRAALRALGELDQRCLSALLHALIDVVGSEGTIVGLAAQPLLLLTIYQAKEGLYHETLRS